MELQWPLIIFTLFICLGAGTFCVAGLLAGLGKGEKLQLSAVVVALAAVVIGGIASFVHLQHWDRAFNGFGHLTSGITQELIAIVVFV
ncbi:MAG: dimethyl sulfoxide reductase anchor subunit, partial [Coriobacteriales bacterium]|nr:dimethyl sulfoxide reductase anchor subunit [Coriobacteriales bacterium]